MGEVLVITSGKGGVGNTTTTANIGTGLAQLGRKVVMIDTDIGLRNLDVVMGLENKVTYNIVDIINDDCSIEQALVKDPKSPNLYLIPAAQTKDKTAVTPSQMREVVMILKEQFDYVIIDCPAGIEQGFKNAIAGADKAIVVTTPEVSAVRDADRIIGLLESNGLANPRLIVNRLRPEMVARGDMMSAEDVVDILGVELLGQVVDDESVVISTNNGEPLVGDGSAAGQSYMRICKRIMGEYIPIAPLEQKKPLFFWQKKIR